MIVEQNSWKMYLNTRNIKNAGLISTFRQCPFDNTVEGCPFIYFHNLNSLDKQIKLLNQFSEEELKLLGSHHQSCIAVRKAKIFLRNK